MRRLARWAASLAVVLVAGLRAPLFAADVSVQEALLRAKPAVALVIAEVTTEVQVDCGRGPVRVKPPMLRETGTAWFVDPAGWMVTNAHVVSPAHQPPGWLLARQRRQAVDQACGPGAAAGVFAGAQVKAAPSLSVMLSNGSRWPARVVKYSPPVAGEAMSGRDLALLKLEVSGMPTLPLADSGAVQLGDRLHILGFPGVVLSHELLGAGATMEASVTSGAVSGFKQDLKNQPVIQTDAPAAWGNSGGPAVNDHGEVVGVLTFVSLSEGARGEIVQGFNFVIPTAAVRDFLAGTGVRTGQRSRFDEAWRAGLGRFFAGDYGGALARLAEADRLLPGLRDVRRLMGEAKNPPPRPFPWATVAGAVAALSLVGWGALLGLRWQRNRYRIRPSEVVHLMETSAAPPLILDVRAPSAYAKSPVRIPDSRYVSPEALAAGAAEVDGDRARTIVAYCT